MENGAERCTCRQEQTGSLQLTESDIVVDSGLWTDLIGIAVGTLIIVAQAPWKKKAFP